MSNVKKQVILFVVEGPSDEESLAGALRKIFVDRQLLVQVTHCDLTSERGAAAHSIRARIGQAVKDYLAETGLRNSDIAGVIQITDTDGSFVDDTLVITDEKVGGIRYSTEEIRTPNAEAIVERNARKRTNVRTLVKTKSILKSIPFQIVFFSSSLEHVLHNKLNLSSAEKKRLASEFSRKYGEGDADFLAFITNAEFSLHALGYNGSWEFIFEGKHSLERWTNLAVCFNAVKRPEEAADSDDAPSR